jgi:hypothetical protein
VATVGDRRARLSRLEDPLAPPAPAPSAGLDALLEAQSRYRQHLDYTDRLHDTSGRLEPVEPPGPDTRTIEERKADRASSEEFLEAIS